MRAVGWNDAVGNRRHVTSIVADRVVLRLLADRDHQITAQRTRTICRLHALLCLLIEGGTGRSLTAAKAEALLVSGPGDDTVRRERLDAGRQLLDEIRVLDAARIQVRKRTTATITASATTVTDVYGIGPLMAAIVIGRVGDIGRFPPVISPDTTEPHRSKRHPVRRNGID